MAKDCIVRDFERSAAGKIGGVGVLLLMVWR